MGDKYHDNRSHRGGHTDRGDRDGRGGSILGKRSRKEKNDSSDTDPEVRKIPMPRDTPSPIPHRKQNFNPPTTNPTTGANSQEITGERSLHSLPSKPPILSSKTTYESAPALRNLRKEATNFVPAAVQRKLDTVKGTGGRLIEEEEMLALEAEGYVVGALAPKETEATIGAKAMKEAKGMKEEGFTEDMEDILEESRNEEEERVLKEEEDRFRREMKQVTIEEVEDEDL